MPTSATNTYSNAGIQPMYDGGEAMLFHVALPASVTYPAGTVLGEVTATPGLFKAYASGSSDGSQIPRAILQYPCITDASSNITEGTVVGAAPFGVTTKSTPAYFTGFFQTAELTGLDAGGVAAAQKWSLINGSVTAGTLQIG